MRKTILFFCLIYFTQFSFCQTGNFSLGLANNVIISLDKNPENYFFSPGVIADLKLGSRVTTEVGFFLEKKTHRFIQGGLIFGSDIINGTSSILVADIEEKYFHFNHIFKYYLLKKEKVRPFLGLGYSLRFVYDLNGERRIEVSNGTTENLNGASSNRFYIHPGVLSNGGVDFFINDKWMITTQVRWNHFLKTNLPRYNPLLNTIDNDAEKVGFSNLVITIGALYIFPPKNKDE